MTKDSPGDLTFETMITILTIKNLTSVNHSYLTINCDTGQHSQFLRCLFSIFDGVLLQVIYVKLKNASSADISYTFEYFFNKIREVKHIQFQIV